MTRLFGLGVRIGLINLAIFASSSWIFSHWFTLDGYIGVPGHEAFLHCDVGGWYVDIRSNLGIPIAWDLNLQVTENSERQDEQSDSLVAFRSLIDRFDIGRHWDLTLPGFRCLLNSRLGLGTGSQVGVGLRHWLIFTLAMMFICVCSFYSARKRRAAGKSNLVGRREPAKEPLVRS